VEGRYVLVAHERVTLREPGLTASTDLTGRYLFRDLAAGSYTMAVQNHPETWVRTIRLGAQPVDLKNVDFPIGSHISP
jgi:hypothetical protein